MISRPERRAREGLSILEVLVSLVILAVIGAAIFSSTNPEKEDDQARTQAVATKLTELREAIAGFEPTQTASSFHQTTGVYPSRLSHLTAPIAMTQNNSCGAPYTGNLPGTNVASWVGPYYSFEMKTAGTLLGQGFMTQDLMVRTPTVAGVYPAIQPGTLAIRFPSVAIDDANALELLIDGTVNTAAGHVRFTPSGTAPVQVDYMIVVYGC
ncbi:MAG: type II secretion system protein [Gemmatimonadaceae bacterium]